MSLRGRVAVVAGGGHSVGRGYAQALAESGMNVVVADPDLAAGEHVVAKITAAGGTARFVELDPTTEQSTRAAIDFAVTEFGRLDTLVNNLANYGESHFRPLTEISLEEWDRTMNLIVRGVWLTVKAAVPHLLKSDQAAIVNSTTVAAYGVSHWLDMGVARAAVVAATKSMAMELTPQGIRVNTICVGSMGMEAIELGIVQNEEQMTSTPDFKRQTIQRLGTGEDVAEAVRFLAGPGSSYMSGQILVIDGGKIFVS